jgi:DNA-binding XRE family transcriptional regulator
MTLTQPYEPRTSTSPPDPDRSDDVPRSDQERRPTPVRPRRDTDDPREAGARLSAVVVPDVHCTQKVYREGVGARLRTVRVLSDISQDELAVAAGVSRNFVSAVERGAQGLDAYRLSLIATALRIPLLMLLAGEGWDRWLEESFGRLATPGRR